jgi:hypothetical protein
MNKKEEAEKLLRWTIKHATPENVKSHIKKIEEQNNIMRKSFICNKCRASDTCRYAWDGYNLGHDGDICLAEK